jgi:NhaP-type Na+/H+ and K+/H+ antiporter
MTNFLLVFSVTLLLAILLSALAHRTVLSTAVLFLTAGFLAGDGALGLVQVTPDSPLVTGVANDGLALPFVVVLLAVASGASDLHVPALAAELSLGLLLGVVVPWAAIRLERIRLERIRLERIRLERTRLFAVSEQYLPLNAVAIGLLVLALGRATHANLFLAAFTAGITVATVGQREREAFEHFGELVAEILKLTALLLFGALLSPSFFGGIAGAGWAFALLAIALARPRPWRCRSWAPGSVLASRRRPPGSGPRGSPRWCTACSSWPRGSPPEQR